MIKAAVAVVGEGGSRVVVRGIRHGSDLNQEDLGAGCINSSALGVGCPHRRSERKFEKVLFAPNVPMELKTSANES